MSARVSRWTNSRDFGPAIETPQSVEACDRTKTSAGGFDCQNQRMWNSSAKPEPTIMKRSSVRQAIERSPTMRPAGLSIGASASRPGFGILQAKTRSSQALCAASGHLVFAIVGGLVDPDALANRAAFGRDDREGLGTAIGRRLRSRDALGREPRAHAPARNWRPSPRPRRSTYRRSASGGPAARREAPRWDRRGGSGAHSFREP